MTTTQTVKISATRHQRISVNPTSFCWICGQEPRLAKIGITFGGSGLGIAGKVPNGEVVEAVHCG